MLHVFLCLPAFLSVWGCISALVFWNVEGAQGVNRISQIKLQNCWGWGDLQPSPSPTTLATSPCPQVPHALVFWRLQVFETGEMLAFGGICPAVSLSQRHSGSFHGQRKLFPLLPYQFMSVPDVLACSSSWNFQSRQEMHWNAHLGIRVRASLKEKDLLLW